MPDSQSKRRTGQEQQLAICGAYGTGNTREFRNTPENSETLLSGGLGRRRR